MSGRIDRESTNVLIIGKSGVGKSSLVNYMFGRELQKVGIGAPVTRMEIKEFTYKYDDHFEMHIYDTWGLEPGGRKAEEWKETIFREIERHDLQNISDWFNTIIFCLNAKSSRIEDFELDIMEQLLKEQNHLTIALTHCNSKEDPDGIVLRERVMEELKERGIETLKERSFVFVSNVKKKLIGGYVEQFGREEIFTSIIRNVWASLRSKVPYQARLKFEKLFALKKEELLKKPDRLRWFMPFMKKSRISRLEKEINQNCNAFVNDLVREINAMYQDAVEYYSELSRQFSVIGFDLEQGDFEASADIQFDALLIVKEQVASDLRLLRERLRFLDDILSDDRVEQRIRRSIVDFRIFLRDRKRIRQDLKAELNRYMDTVKQYLDEHLNRIEADLAALDIDDLYIFQAGPGGNGAIFT